MTRSVHVCPYPSSNAQLLCDDQGSVLLELGNGMVVRLIPSEHADGKPSSALFVSEIPCDENVVVGVGGCCCAL